MVVDESERNLEAEVDLVNIRIIVGVDEDLYILAPKYRTAARNLVLSDFECTIFSFSEQELHP